MAHPRTKTRSERRTGGAMIAAGAGMMLVGIPLLVLPGPGLVVIGAGAIVAGRGITRLRQSGHPSGESR